MRRFKLPLILAVLVFSASVPMSACEADPTTGCCRVCREGKACGDSCIAENLTCNAGPGCACNG